jgi:hypothetical protein
MGRKDFTAGVFQKHPNLIPSWKADHGRLDEAELAARIRKELRREFKADCGKQLILNWIDALEGVVLTQTAKSLPDAAVQVVIAYGIVVNDAHGHAASGADQVNAT